MRNITSIGLILLGVCAIADADLVDNFESYALNTWPATGWTKDGNADGLVVLDPTNPSNQIVRCGRLLLGDSGVLPTIFSRRVHSRSLGIQRLAVHPRRRP